MFFGDHFRDDGARGRKVKGANDAEQRDDGINPANRTDTVDRDPEEKRGADSKSGVAKEQDGAAPEAVHGVAGNEKQANSGQELSQADESQVERAVRNRIHLPGNGAGLHLTACHDEPASEQKKRKTRVSESDSLRE